MEDERGPWEQRTYDFVEGRPSLGDGEGFFLDIENDVLGAPTTPGADEQNLVDALDRVPLDVNEQMDLEVGMVEGTARGILLTLQKAGVPEAISLSSKLDDVLVEYQDRPAYLLHFTLLSVLMIEVHDAKRTDDQEIIKAAQDEFNVGQIVESLTSARLSLFHYGPSPKMHDMLSQLEMKLAEMSLSDNTLAVSLRLVEEIRQAADE